MENEFIDRAMQDAKETEAKKAKAKKASKKVSSIKKSKGPSTFVQILNGDFLTKEFMLKNLNFIFFIMLLLLLIVGKGYYGKKLSADVQRTQKELDEATSDYFEAKASLEEKTRRTELVEKLENTGLKETVNPTKVIRVKKEEAE
ncbi:MAG TPA: hypothetical protein EYG86_07010 [Crocinitomicaceae bacterium]|nr:hypothetical protein [Crocinitomicaceae bacterium]